MRTSAVGFATRVFLKWINFRGSDSYHEIHEILYATKFNTRTVYRKISQYRKYWYFCSI